MRPLNILIVDDEAPRRVEFSLKLRGHSLTMVDNPLEGIRQVRTRKFDLIFLDHDLNHPSLCGQDVASCFFNTSNTRTRVCIHSANPIGTMHMHSILTKDLGMKEVVAISYVSDNFWEDVKEIVSEGQS